ncbi:SIMPL domain-containing protein [Croceitalea marina]|uniref:SIMPL domain-containing protein n=1 Tax=Croceitalea marina TaxID=1775166 RepID=A0ABW5MV11_9FLAO
MKINWLKVVLVSVSIAVAGYFIGNMHKTAKQYDRFVQVKGLSEREVDADLAVWPINITLTANNLMTLKKDIENQNEALYNYFVEQGFKKEELTQGSTNINDTWSDLYNNKNAQFRYLAKSEFTVRTKNIGQLQKALSESTDLMTKGILISSKNTWRPIEYIFDGLNDIKPSMIEESTKNAREVADKFALDSDSKVGKIRMAKQGLFTISDRDLNTPQIKVVRVVSTIDFQLED